MVYDKTELNEHPFLVIFGWGRNRVGQVKLLLVLKHSPSGGSYCILHKGICLSSLARKVEQMGID